MDWRLYIHEQTVARRTTKAARLICVLNGWRYRLSLVVNGPTTRAIKDKCSAKSMPVEFSLAVFASITLPLIRKD
jgi:hypothetical protein